MNDATAILVGAVTAVPLLASAWVLGWAAAHAWAFAVLVFQEFRR